VKEEFGNENRRGLVIKVVDQEVSSALHKLDERILQEAMIKSRYKPIIYKDKPTDDFEVIKIKVKTGNSEFKTQLHLKDADGKHRKNAGRPEDIGSNCEVVPIVSASYGIWFFGGSQFGLSFQAEEMIISPNPTEEEDLSHFGSSVPLEMADSPRKDEIDVKIIGEEDEGSAM
jgi:hypothetical protein